MSTDSRFQELVINYAGKRITSEIQGCPESTTVNLIDPLIFPPNSLFPASSHKSLFYY